MSRTIREELGLFFEVNPVGADQMMASPGPLEGARFSPSKEGALLLADLLLASALVSRIRGEAWTQGFRRGVNCSGDVNPDFLNPYQRTPNGKGGECDGHPHP